MSDDIIISGGGSTEVVTSELLSQRHQLQQLSAEVNRCETGLRSIDGLVTRARLQAAGTPLGSLRAETAMADAQGALRSARNRATSLADSLQQAASKYGEAESVADALVRTFSSMFAYQIGAWLPLIAPLFLPSALVTGGVVAGVWSLMPEHERSKAEAVGRRDVQSLLSDPRFVSMLRLAVSSSDDFGEGMMHVPEPLNEILGDDGLGILGVSSSAAVVVGRAGMLGMLRETSVSTTCTSHTAGTPPRGLGDRAARIPTDGNQIRIDTYSEPGAPNRYEVYLGGTIDMSLTAGTEPWDMTSNLNGVAGGMPGSLVAARQAMDSAGIDSTTPVTFTGYSQGGLLAAELAASGDYDTRGLVTFGGPAGSVPVPHDIPYVALEHADDLVPATGGVWKSSDPLVVSRTVYADQPYTGAEMVPAHQLSNYQETARIADASGESRLVRAQDSLREFAQRPTTVDTAYFHAIRTSQHAASDVRSPVAEGCR